MTEKKKPTDSEEEFKEVLITSFYAANPKAKIPRTRKSGAQGLCEGCNRYCKCEEPMHLPLEIGDTASSGGAWAGTHVS